MPKMTYPWTCINFKKKAHQSSHQLLTRVATCLWKDVNKGENLEFELWVSQFPVGGSVYGSFFKFPIFHCKRGELNEEKTFPLLQLHCQAVFCLITLGDHRFSPANQQGSTKKKNAVPGLNTWSFYRILLHPSCLPDMFVEKWMLSNYTLYTVYHFWSQKESRFTVNSHPDLFLHLDFCSIQWAPQDPLTFPPNWFLGTFP